MSAKHPNMCTIPCIVSYANLNQPRAFGDQEPKYSGSLIVKKSDVTAKARIDAAMRAAYEDGLSILKGKSKVAPSFEDIIADGPLHDGDTKIIIKHSLYSSVVLGVLIHYYIQYNVPDSV